MDQATLELPNGLCIGDMVSVHDRLLKALDDNAHVLLSIDSAADMDVCFLQLIESARLEAEASGKRLDLSRPADGRLLDLVRRSGILTDNDLVDRRFWMHQENEK